jgi:hypothetical protein
MTAAHRLAAIPSASGVVGNPRFTRRAGRMRWLIRQRSTRTSPFP